YDDLASTAASGGVSAHRGSVLHLYRRLCVLVLVSDHASAPNGLDGRSTHRLDRRDSICSRPDRNAHPRLELRSHRRTAVAFCISSTNRRARAECVVFYSAFESASHCRIHAARLRHSRGGVLPFFWG